MLQIKKEESSYRTSTKTASESVKFTKCGLLEVIPMFTVDFAIVNPSFQLIDLRNVEFNYKHRELSNFRRISGDGLSYPHI
jgi:hypothetical protein